MDWENEFDTDSVMLIFIMCYVDDKIKNESAHKLPCHDVYTKNYVRQDYFSTEKFLSQFITSSGHLKKNNPRNMFLIMAW